MQLEPLLTSLDIPQFIPQLSEFRDNLLREKAAELKSLTDAHGAEIAAALATNATELAKVQADLAAKNALIDSAKDAIKSAIADVALDDAARVAAIASVVAASEMPYVEKRKLEIAAEIAAKQAELDAL
jgi:hypothetical protein